MKKNVFFLGTLCLVTLSLIFSGCKKENNDPQEPAKVQTYKMSITASKGADNQANGPRRVLGLDGTTLNATWAENDAVTVYNETKGAALEGTLKAETAGASVQFSGEVSGEVEKGDMLTLKFLAPSYAEQKGTLAYISANCDYAIATDVEVTGIVDETIYTDGETTFENQQAVVEFTLQDKGNSNALISASELVVKVGTATYTVKPDAAASKLYVAIPGFASQTVTLTAKVGSNTYAYEKAGVTFANGKFYQITAKLTKQAPEGAINGKFSVSPSLKVYFSKGNLKYTRESTSVDWSTGKFSFMDNQYDYIETTADPYCEADYANKTAIGFFGWAASGISRTGVNAYLPYSTSSTNGEDYGTTTTKSASETLGNYDWGKNMGDGWRTLTAEEWGYLLGPGNLGTTPSAQRANYQSLRGLCKITVSGTDYPGMIILPDDLYNNLPTKDDIATKWAACAVAAGSLDYAKATFTEEEWTALQKAGAVFLPAAGDRMGTTVYLTGARGYYWSSSASLSTHAFYLHFRAGGLYPEHSFNRCYGFSVRLVKNVE